MPIHSSNHNGFPFTRSELKQRRRCNQSVQPSSSGTNSFSNSSTDYSSDMSSTESTKITSTSISSEEDSNIDSNNTDTDSYSTSSTASTSEDEFNQSSSTSSEEEWVERLPFKNIEDLDPSDGIVICEEHRRINEGKYSPTKDSLNRYFSFDRPIAEQLADGAPDFKLENCIFQAIDATIPNQEQIENEECREIFDLFQPYMFSNKHYDEYIENVLTPQSPELLSSSSESASSDDDMISDGKNDNEPQLFVTDENTPSGCRTVSRFNDCNIKRALLMKCQPEYIECDMDSEAKEAINPDRPSFIEIEENEWLCDSANQRRTKVMPCECTTSETDRAFGKAACGEQCLNRLMMIECTEKVCPCMPYCTNQRFLKRENASLVPFRTEWKGWGVKTLRDLNAGVFVIEYIGEVLEEEMFLQRLTDYEQAGQKDYYFMSLDRPFIIDATIKGNISRLINHSCDANCVTQKWNVGGRIRIGLFTCKDIKAGTELNFDYKYETMGNENTVCYCKSENCRGFIGSRCTNPAWLQRSDSSEHDADDTFKNIGNRERTIYPKLQLDMPKNLRSDENMLKLISCMLSVTNSAVKVHILNFILISADAEPACLKSFISNHGLPVLFSWMTGIEIGEANLGLQLRLIEVLERLPLKTKNELEESKLLSLVSERDWSRALEWSLPEEKNTNAYIEDKHSQPQQVKSVLKIMVMMVEKRLDVKIVKLVNRVKALKSRWDQLPHKSSTGHPKKPVIAVTTSLPSDEVPKKVVNVEFKTEAMSKRAELYKRKGFRVYSTNTPTKVDVETFDLSLPRAIPNQQLDAISSLHQTTIKQPVKLHKHFIKRAEMDQIISKVEPVDIDMSEDSSIENEELMSDLKSSTSNQSTATPQFSPNPPSMQPRVIAYPPFRTPNINFNSSPLFSPSPPRYQFFNVDIQSRMQNCFSPNVYSRPNVVNKFLTASNTLFNRPSLTQNSFPRQFQTNFFNQRSAATMLIRNPCSTPVTNIFPRHTDATQFIANFPVFKARQQIPNRFSMINQYPTTPPFVSQIPNSNVYPSPISLTSSPICNQILTQPLTSFPPLASEYHPVIATSSQFENRDEDVVIVEEAEIRHVMVKDPTTGQKKMIQKIVKKPSKLPTTDNLNDVAFNKPHEIAGNKRTCDSLNSVDGNNVHYWKMARTDQGFWYYYDPVTGCSQWERPTGVMIEGIDDVYSSSTNKVCSTTNKEDSYEDTIFTNDTKPKEKEVIKTTKQLSLDERIKRHFDDKSIESLKDSTSKTTSSVKSKKPKPSKPSVKKHERDTSSSSSSLTSRLPRKTLSEREKFKAELTKVIVKLLTPYRKSSCTKGHIQSSEDFKYLTRKFTHSIVEKEEQRCVDNPGHRLEMSKRIRVKSDEYVNKYMSKFLKEYSRKQDHSD
ncbi:hypothetical protein GJ496_007259 [Pomphorhynchus laevis]|nr:hypothetical protein GJ496_007259 [Pomphorhynchus laevis]